MKKNLSEILLVSSSTLTFMGNGMHFIALSWLILSITNNPLSVGILIACSTIPGMITSLFAGVLADRLNKKIVVISMDIIRFLLIMIIVALLHFDIANQWYLYIITILLTISSNLFFPAFSGLIKNTINPDNYLKVMSANSTGLQFGVIIGSGIAGYLIIHTSLSMVFIIDGLTFLLSALLLLKIKYTDKRDKSITSSKGSFKNEFIEGFNYVFSNKTFGLIFLIGAFPHTMTQLINALLAFYTDTTLKLGVKAYGILDASYAVGSVVMGLFLLSYVKNKISLERIISYSLFLMGIGTFIIAISNSFYLSIIGLGIIGAAVLSEVTSSKTILLSMVDEKYIGRTESLSWAIYSSVPPLIGLFSTFVVTKISVNVIFGFFCILLFFMSFYSNSRLTNYKYMEKVENH